METRRTILIVEASSRSRARLEELLRQAGHRVEAVAEVEAAVARLADAQSVDVVLAALESRDADGFGLLSWVRGQAPGLPVVLMAATPTIETTVRAIHGGAHELLPRPLDEAELLRVVRHAIKQRHHAPPVDLNGHAREEAGLLGGSPPMVEVYRLVARAARARVPVLIAGESGTGKELVARAIHQHSERRSGHFVALNCGALSDTLLESELFGHVRGAFTGAERERRGLFVHADGGTLFLDEIGEVSPRLQVQLLRTLQSGEVRPVGSDTISVVDVRVIAATHRDLQATVRAGAFREDLFYRLKVAEIRVPPLRDRSEDIPMLIDRFLRAARRPVTVDEDALTLLQAWHWPGNVRELENVIARAAAMGRGPVITPADLPLEIRGEEASENIDGGIRTLADMERDYVRRVLARCEGNKSRAARALGIDRKTLGRVLAR